jgi:uncharacterized protein (TIGR00297 family)
VYHSPTWLVGLGLASAIAILARRAGALTTSGAVAAAIVGTVAVAAGWSWGVLLIAYFTSTALLSRFRANYKAARTGGVLDKQGPRDAAQVLANGGVFTVAAVAHWMSPAAIWQAAAAGALAASAADSWATEIGTLARASPRSILTRQPVATGTSGGVTVLGFLAAALGAAFVAAVAWTIRWPAVAIAAALVGGGIGCLLDSVLGASLQARRWCASCGNPTEQRIHRCGTLTSMTGGMPWLNNDGVNVICTASGALFGAAVASYF